MAWALECDGVDDYLTTSISNDDDILKISANIKFDVGTIDGDDRLIAFDPAGSCFIGFGTYQGKLRVFSRDNNGHFVALSSSSRVDTGEFVEASWQLNKLTGTITTSVNGSENSATNANSTTYPTTLTSSVLMSQTATSGRLKAQVSTIAMTDTTTSSNSFFLDATASDHSNTGAQPVLVETIGGNNAVGVNFPTDGSAWVDLGGGGGELNIVGSTPSYSFAVPLANVDLTGELNIVGSTPSYSFAVPTAVVDLTGELEIVGSTPSYSFAVPLANVDLTGDLSIVGTTPTYSYTAVRGVVSFSGGACLEIKGDITLNSKQFSGHDHKAPVACFESIGGSVTIDSFNK
tara:strand:+ start:7738 stop:8778 length:1041 start_codon:yes stop_codon:yes gene_type:complete